MIKKMTAIFVLLIMLISLAAFNLNKPAKKNQSQQPQPNFLPLDQKISEYLSAQDGTYGLYFIDLRSGKGFGYNQYTSFHAASTFKLPMNLYLYTLAAKGELNLDQKLTYLEKHKEGGTGILKDYNSGGEYSIKELAAYSIVNSDNIAANIILDKLDKKKVKNFMRDLGGKVVDDDKNITCPYDLALYMKKTVEFSQTDNPEAQMLINSLLKSEYKERIPAGLPSGVKVANKIGSWPDTNTYNDVAYVVHPAKPYILAITSKETPGFGSAIPVIRKVSEMVYSYQTAENTP